MKVCKICLAKFSSSSALGGHMTKHRNNNVSATTATELPRYENQAKKLANDARSGRKTIEEEDINSKKKLIDNKGLSACGPGMTSSMSSRSFAANASSGERTSCSPSTRKSERLEKLTPLASLVKMKSEKDGKHLTQSPLVSPVKTKSERDGKYLTENSLRRSERSKKDVPSSSPESRYSAEGLNSIEANRKKVQREKSLNELNIEAEKVDVGRENDQESSGKKRKIMNARSYRALFNQQHKKGRVSDNSRTTDAPCDTELMEPSGKEGSCLRELANDTGDKCSERFENGVASISRDVGEAELPSFAERASPSPGSCVRELAHDTGDECSQRFEDGVAIISGDVGVAELPSLAERPSPSPGSSVRERANDTGDKCSLEDGVATISGDVGEAELPSLAERPSPSPGSSVRELANDTGDKCSLEGGVATISGDVGEAELPSLAEGPSPSPGSSVRELANDTGDKCSLEDSVASMSGDVGEAELPSFAERASPSPEERNCSFAWTCGNCSKRLRLKHDSPEQELCSCNGGKDPVKLGSCGKLVEASCDLPMCCHDKVCYVCRKDGNLLFCHGMGCGNCYHSSCLDDCLGDVQPMVWHCIWCVKKKIDSGVHSVSKGVEEIWDFREVVISDSKGKHLQKQYLVKYQGLAHVYNHWVPEIVLHPELSHVVERFIQKQQQGLSWNKEWTVPHRLLKKRSIKFPEHQNSSSSCPDSITGCCQYEWLVRWSNLGYEHVSWEFEDADFLQSSLGKKLVKEYELRMEKVKRVVDKSCEDSYVQLTKLPSGGSTITDSIILNNVNKLREFWYKNQNAVVFDDQNRVVSSIFFILSLADIGHPFLVISDSDDASLWETEFMQVAPFVDLLVYAGNEETRRRIRALEFYEEGSRVIPQVLLAPSEVALEDVHLLKDLSWGVILIDDLNGRVSMQLEQMKMLTTSSRVILFASQLKDRVTDYLGLLSLLEFRDSSKFGGVKSDNNITKLKQQLSRYIAYGCLAEPSKFVEYWVPAHISNWQLEQYCATLLSNSTCLCSCSKNDLVGALRETLSTLRKCCDHPYLVDSTLQGLIIKGLPLSDILDVGIKASGKLQLLDMILSEIKARQLRVLIIFQPIIGSAMHIGDILEDFVLQRFGQNSYERVDTHVAKKQAALNRFNKKESGQFVFLLEKGGCLPSIKLASVDTVVIFDSDWNPGTDLKALQRISIDSQFQQIKVFRLYSAFTIEEKALILAKQDKHIDNDIQNVGRSNIGTLLSWGVSYLFNRLEEFHKSKSGTMLADMACEDSLANNVLMEFQVILTTEAVSKDSLISKARQLRGVYCTDFPLLGESKIKSTVEEEPHIFWKNLLEDRNACWRFPCSVTRNRKRVQYFDGSSNKPEMENGNLVKKRRKEVDNIGEEPDAGHCVINADQSLLVPATGRGASSLSPASSPNSHDTISPGEINQDQSVQRLISTEPSVYIHLTLEMEKLCEILALKEDTKHMLDAFMGYVVENHRVSKEEVAIFQALQISLCWIAASMLKQKIDRRNSLILAKQKLNFECSDEVAEHVYKKLRMLKKTFLQQPNIIMELQALIKPASTEGNVVKDVTTAKALEPAHITSESQETANEENLTHPEHAQEGRGTNHESETRSMSILHEKQQQEIDEFNKLWEGKRLLLEKNKLVEAAVIRNLLSQNTDGKMEKLKKLEFIFLQNLEEHKKLMEAGLKDLKAKHLVAVIEEREKAKYPGSENRTSNKVSFTIFPDTGLTTFNGTQGNTSLSDLHIEEHTHNDTADKLLTSNLISHGISVGCKMTNLTCNKVVKDLQSHDAAVSDLAVDTAGCTSTIDSDHLHVELVNDMRTSEGSQYAAPVSTMVDAVACDIRTGIICTQNETDNNLHSNGDTLLDICVDAAEAEQCTVMEIESIPGAIISEDSEVPVAETTSGLEDDDPNVVAHPSRKGIDSSETATSNGKRHDKQFSGEANESIPTDLPEDAHEEVRSTDDPDTITTSIQSTGVDDCEDRVVGYVTHGLLGNQRDDAIVTDPSPDRSSLVALPCEVIDSVDHAISAPMQQAITNELPQCATSAEVQEEDQPNQDNVPNSVASIESEDVAQLVTTNNLTAVAGASSVAADNQLAAEVNNPTCFEQQTPSKEHVPLGPEFGGSACQLLNYAGTSLQVIGTTHQVDSPTNDSQQHRSQVAENLGQSSSTDTGNPNIDNNNQSLPPVSNQGGEPSSGLYGSLHLVGQPSVVDDGSVQGTNPSVLLAANQFRLSNSHPNLQTDPLQIELEKLRKQIEQTVKGHENLKLQLGSDCEKEIAEVVARIRNKYEAKVKDAEAMFQQKKKALDTNVNKIFLNKILADAVSSKCVDVRPSGGWRQQGFMQQLQEIPLQSTPANAVPLSAGGTLALQQNTSLTLPAEPRSAAHLVGASCRPPMISSIAFPQANAARVGGDIRASAPHLQPFGADVRASAPHLQPVVADIRAAAPHLQPFGADVRASAPHLQPVGGDIRTAAPHLQPFRQPVSVSAPSRFSLPHSVNTINQPSPTLPSHVLPVRPQISSAIQMSEPSPQTPQTHVHMRRPLSQTFGSQICPSGPQRVGPTSYHSAHPSALDLLNYIDRRTGDVRELLKDMDRRRNAVQTNPSVSPVFPDTNVPAKEQSALRGVQGGSTSSVVPSDVVYLSDDE